MPESAEANTTQELASKLRAIKGDAPTVRTSFDAADLIEAQAAEIARLIDEVQRLRQRLEISDDHPHDGIAARDATIQGLEREAEQLRAALSSVIRERDAATVRLKAMTQAGAALLGEAENVDGERFSASWDAHNALMGTLPNENRLALNASYKDDSELLVDMSIILSPRDEVGAVDRSTLRVLCDQERDPSAAWDACVEHMQAPGLKFSDGGEVA